MFAIQRLESILELLNEKGIVQVNELVKLLNVSDVTIRKDLNKLQKDGLITKTHGGAILNKDITVPSLISPPATNDHPESIDMLAEYVSSYIEDGDTLFLGSGNSCTALAQHLGDFKDLAIITNNVEAIQHLRGKCKTVILIGGEIIFHRSHSFTTSTQINEYLSSYNITKAITSCSGIDLKVGISVSTEVSKNIISAVIKVAGSWYLIADQGKFDCISPYKIADIDRPAFIITDIVNPRYNTCKNIVNF
jgi:DeoR family fructose operon transcriptional repressor